MTWSWKICRIAGIPIYTHWTFLILIAWLVFYYLGMAFARMPSSFHGGPL